MRSADRQLIRGCPDAQGADLYPALRPLRDVPAHDAARPGSDQVLIVGANLAPLAGLDELDLSASNHDPLVDTHSKEACHMATPVSAVRMERAWAMPHRSTFSIAPIRKLIAETVPLFGTGWIDPFAGWASPAEITNDLNPDTPADHHLTALDFLATFADESVEGVLFDPPYSPRQVSECYQQIGRDVTVDDTKATFWSDCKHEIARILAPGGLVMCFGWNSNGIGKGRGFALTRVLTVAHGGHHNDTIVTVERKAS